jgi:3-dehydroquinate dehydratase II
MAKILLLSGPNLNLFGQREPDIYGTTTLDEMVAAARDAAARHGHDLEHVQSNHEGALIDAVHAARGRCAALIVNAGALSHYSYALADALATFSGVKVELHVSNPHARDAWRHVSVVAPVVTGTIAGFGARGYPLAVDAAATALEGT